MSVSNLLQPNNLDIYVKSINNQTYSKALGTIYNSSVITPTLSNTWTKLLSVLVSKTLVNFANNNDSSLTYTGLTPVNVLVTACVSLAPTVGCNFIVGLSKNNIAPSDTSGSQIIVATGGVSYNFAPASTFQLVTGDTLQIVVYTAGTPTNITTNYATLSAISL